MIDFISVKEKESNNIWDIKSDGFYCDKVVDQMIEDGMSEDATDRIVENGVKILAQCPNPNVKGKETKTGIVIGKVQSGKTSNFITTLALAFDNGYQIAVVLGGNKKNLAQQNTDRLVQAFNTKKLVILNTESNATMITTDRIKEFLLNGRKVIIVGLKHPTHINNIKTVFEDTVLSEYPTIIIDDEGDQATLNTKVYKDEMSSTYTAVLELLKCIDKNCFLSITATPQANILIQTCDILSPDFGELVYPGNAYCGLEEFHGDDRDKYCKIIKEDETPLLCDEGTPVSLYYALADFFIGGAIRKYRGDKRSHAMLIHPSIKVAEQKIVSKKVNGVLMAWKTNARNKVNGIEDVAYESLKNELYLAYYRFKKDGVQVPEFDKLENICLDLIINSSEALQCNSEENATENAKFWDTTIFVGGNMVERGITIKGLAVTYITRRAKGKSNVDNTEQRARWFGYKDDFLDVCRVWMPEQIKEDFSNILKHDEDLWATIESNQIKGVRFKDIPRCFELNSELLRLTRTSVAHTKNVNVSEWNSQNRFISDKTIALDNSNIIENFRQKINNACEIIQYSSLNKNILYKDVDLKKFYDQVLDKIFYCDTEKINNKFFRTIVNLLLKIDIDNPKLDVMWMRDGVGEERAINNNNILATPLFQGRYQNQNSKNYYPGDRSMALRRSDKLHIQVHYVKPSNNKSIDHYCPFLTLYVPMELATRLSRFVTNEGGFL